jgi:hypothetical protein
MRRWWLVVSIVMVAVAVSLAATACSEDSTKSLPRPTKAFCQAAFKLDDRLPKIQKDVAKQITLVEPIAANAPKDIKDDAQTFLDALRRYQDGDRSDRTVDNPKVKTAIENVNRRAADGCNFYKQDPGSGI